MLEEKHPKMKRDATLRQRVLKFVMCKVSLRCTDVLYLTNSTEFNCSWLKWIMGKSFSEDCLFRFLCVWIVCLMEGAETNDNQDEKCHVMIFPVRVLVCRSSNVGSLGLCSLNNVLRSLGVVFSGRLSPHSDGCGHDGLCWLCRNVPSALT